MVEFPEPYRDLLDAQFATLGTVEPDGTPQLSELWFLYDEGELLLYDEGELRLSLNTARRKTQNLSERPQCSLMILDVSNPFRYVEVRGRARIEPDDDGSFAHKLHGKYNTDVAAFDKPGEKRVIVTIEATRIRPVDMSG